MEPVRGVPPPHVRGGGGPAGRRRFEPEGVVERIGDVLDVANRQAVADLDWFKEFMEGQGSAAGGWRGTIEDGDVMSQETEGQRGARTAGDVPGDVVVGPTGDRESTAGNVPGDVVVGPTGDTESTAGNVPGDVVVGPTGDTVSTLTTEPGPTPSTTPAAGYDAIGHSGDPVAVDPDALDPTAASGGVTEAATDPVGETWADDPGSRSTATGTDEAWAPGASGPGEDRGVRDTRGEGVVERDFADEDITTEDVVARDFANRDVSGEGVVERDFANRDITERDIAHRGVSPESAGAPISEPTDAHGGIMPESAGAPISQPSLDAPIAQRAIKPESAGAPISEPTSVDDADAPDRRKG